MARKTAFVNEMILKTLNQHQQTVPPTVKTAASLDEEINTILKRQDMTDYDKAKLYSEILQKYLTVKEKIFPTAIPPTSTSVISESIQESNKSTQGGQYNDASIIQTVPKKYQSRAANMIRFLRQQNNIQWDDKGRVLYKDEIIPESNIIDLINDQMRSRKNINPVGFQVFSKALKEMNVPTELIGNKNRYTTTTKVISSPVHKQHIRQHPYKRSSGKPGNPRWITKKNT